MIRASLHFLRRAPTLERALLTRHIGHFVGVLAGSNNDVVSHAGANNRSHPHDHR